MSTVSPSRRAPFVLPAFLVAGLLIPVAAAGASLPRCLKPLATVTVQEPVVDWWTDEGLGSPRRLLEIFVDESGCFTRVDGRREAGAKPDFALTPDLVTSAAGRDATPGGAGPTGTGPATDGVGAGDDVVGGNREGVSWKTVPPPNIFEVVLELADLRGGTRPLRTRGSARMAGSTDGLMTIRDLGGYSRTAQGRQVANAYLDAYRSLVNAVERQLKKQKPK